MKMCSVMLHSQLWTTAYTTLVTIPDSNVLNLPPDYLLLDSAPNLGPLISCCEINKFKDY